MSSPDSGLPASRARRRFIKTGVLGGAALVVLGGGVLGLRRGRGSARPRRKLLVLDAATYATLAALAARIVPGDGAADWPSAADLDVAGAIDEVLAGLHPADARDFVRFVNLLDNGLFSLCLSGSLTCFADLPPEAQDARLAAWATSRFGLIRSGLIALKRLVHATYYASPAVYGRVGYPGPPTVGQGTAP